VIGDDARRRATTLSGDARSLGGDVRARGWRRAAPATVRDDDQPSRAPRATTIRCDDQLRGDDDQL
jgi:hypothetical protein